MSAVNQTQIKPQLFHPCHLCKVPCLVCHLQVQCTLQAWVIQHTHGLQPRHRHFYQSCLHKHKLMHLRWDQEHTWGNKCQLACQCQLTCQCLGKKLGISVTRELFSASQIQIRSRPVGYLQEGTHSLREGTHSDNVKNCTPELVKCIITLLLPVQICATSGFGFCC